MPQFQGGPGRRFAGMRGIGTPGAGVPATMGGNAVQGQGIPFTYGTPVLASIAAGATAGSINIQFDANSVFVWLRSTFTASTESDSDIVSWEYSTIVVPQINVSIQDTGKGASFMNTPVPLPSIASNIPGLPYILPTPALIQANATWAWTFTNADSAEYYNVQFLLHGFRIFNPNIFSLAEAFGLAG